MVLVDMIIAERVNEITNVKIADVRDEMRQQGIRADVERHAEKCIGRSLIELTVENRTLRYRVRSPTVREGLVHILDLELEQSVTRRQIDIVAFARIPTAND